MLEISTGATSRQGGQFAYALSGINPDEVYEAAGELHGQADASRSARSSPARRSPTCTSTRRSLKIDILRDQAPSCTACRARQIETAAAQRLQPELRLPDQEGRGPVPGDPRDQATTCRKHPEDLRTLYIRSDDGKNLVPLTAVATWEPTVGPQAVNHLNQFTSVTFNFNLMPGVPIGDATDVHRRRRPTRSSRRTSAAQFQGEALTFQRDGARA